jgi:hypothetical protein
MSQDSNTLDIKKMSFKDHAEYLLDKILVLYQNPEQRISFYSNKDWEDPYMFPSKQSFPQKLNSNTICPEFPFWNSEIKEEPLGYQFLTLVAAVRESTITGNQLGSFKYTQTLIDILDYSNKMDFQWSEKDFSTLTAFIDDHNKQLNEFIKLNNKPHPKINLHSIPTFDPVNANTEKSINRLNSIIKTITTKRSGGDIVPDIKEEPTQVVNSDLINQKDTVEPAISLLSRVKKMLSIREKIIEPNNSSNNKLKQ